MRGILDIWLEPKKSAFRNLHYRFARMSPIWETRILHNLTDRCNGLGLCEVRERITLQLPTDIPLEEHPSPEAFLDEAETLVAEAAKEDLLRRVTDGMAAYEYPQPPIRTRK